jgi:hypothetical protein
MNKPTIGLYDLGAGLGVVAGLEMADQITRPVEGAHFRISGFLDSPDTDQVKSYMRDLDVSIESFKNDAAKNVTRPAFLQSLNEWLFGWKKFLSSHSSTTQILLAGRDTTMNQAREYGKQLEGWRDAYQKETGKSPEGQIPTKPPEAGTGMATSTKVLLGAIALAVVGVGGWVFYKSIQNAQSIANENIERGKAFAEKHGERLVEHAIAGG